MAISVQAKHDAPLKLRVLFVLPTYMPETYGGAEQQSRKLALELVKCGVDVTVLAPRLNRKTVKQERDGDINVRRFRLSHAPNLGGRHILSWLKWCAKIVLWFVANRSRYDIVHVIHGRLHAAPAVAMARILKKPVLVKIGRGGLDHFDLDVVRRKRIIGWPLAWFIARRSTIFVANSSEIARDLDRWGVEKTRVQVIPNGVDLPAKIVPTNSQGVRLISIGRLDPEKAIDLTIRGLAQIPDPRLTLTIVGSGGCRESLEKLAGDLGVSNRIVFSGALDNVADSLRHADVFVSTSRSEGMSNALLEAMSFGIPPLASKVSGVEDIVSNGQSGVLFTAGDLDDFVRAMKKIIALSADQRSALGVAARTTMRERFSIAQVAATHLQLYHALMRSERPKVEVIEPALASARET